MPRDNQSRSSRAAASIAAIVVACKARFENAQAGRIGQAQSSPGHRLIGSRPGAAVLPITPIFKAVPRSYTLLIASAQSPRMDQPHA